MKTNIELHEIEFVAVELLGAQWIGTCCHVVPGTYLRFAIAGELYIHR